MDYLTKRIQEKLLARGRAEQARADEWRRSLKPTVYRGNNLFQEMGGEPLEGRYLGQQGLIPGQSVPNIGRNPNKPVIPGLPVDPVPAPKSEETKVIRASADIVFLLDLSGSFGDDLTVWQSIFASLLSSIRKQLNPSWGVATFVDQPLAPFGSAVSGDYAFLNESGATLLNDDQDVIDIINGLSIFNGRDGPESQLYAINQCVTSFNFTKSDRLIVLVTDAQYHYNEPGAPQFGTTGNDFYPTRSEVAENLNNANIQLACLVTSNVILTYQFLLNNFGISGGVAELSSNSSNIEAALLSLLPKLIIFTE